MSSGYHGGAEGCQAEQGVTRGLPGRSSGYQGKAGGYEGEQRVIKGKQEGVKVSRRIQAVTRAEQRG